MNIEEIKNTGLEREYKVTVPAAAIEERVQARLKNLGARAKIPGFRPGHIPMNVLKQRYGNSVLGEAIEDAVNQASATVMREKSLKPAMRPKLEVTEYNDGGDLSFTMALDVLPVIPEIDFSAINLERLAFTVADSEINEALERLADRNKTTKERDAGAKAQKNDVVKIDFVGKLDGVAFDGGSAKNFQLTLGSNQFIPGFEDQLIGSKAGDAVVVKVSFPADYHKADLAGKPTEFDVTVHAVLESVAPEINDEFAKKLGFETLDALKDAVKQQIERDYSNVQRQKLKKVLFDVLEETLSFEVPAGMKRLEFDAIWGRLQDAVKKGEAEMDKPEEELRQEYDRIAERRVRLGLVLADIGTTHNLTVTKEELSRAVWEQARMFPGQEQKVFEFYKQNPAQVDDLRGPILEEKAVDFILAKAAITDRAVSIEELLAEDAEGDAAADKKPAKKSAKKKVE